MSRQVFHSTRANTRPQGRTRRFARVLRLVTLCFNSLPVAPPHRTLLRPRLTATLVRRTRHSSALASAAYFEMVSSAMPFVRGPMNPIAAITTTIAPAMNANTPNVPKPFSTAAITNDEKIAEKRLHE